MNGKIEKLGAFISSQAEAHPGRTAQMLAAAYDIVGMQAAHFPSGSYTRSREYLQSYTARLLAKLLRDPARSAVVNIFMPSEIFCALDMPSPKHWLPMSSTRPANVSSSTGPRRAARRIRSVPFTRC